MDKEQENKFDELYRVIDISAKSRYRASSRLSLHGLFSQWTLSLLAIGLIIVSVVILSNIEVNFTSPYTDVMQIVFSVMILTYSLLLGMGNFTSRSEKLLRCGLELSRVLRRVKHYKGKNIEGEDIEYVELSRSYYDILEKYENHNDVDFLIARISIEQRKGLPPKKDNESEISYFFRYLVKTKSMLFMKLNVYFRKILSFLHYPASFLLVYTWIYLLI